MLSGYGRGGRGGAGGKGGCGSFPGFRPGWGGGGGTGTSGRGGGGGTLPVRSAGVGGGGGGAASSRLSSRASACSSAASCMRSEAVSFLQFTRNKESDSTKIIFRMADQFTTFAISQYNLPFFLSDFQKILYNYHGHYPMSAGKRLGSVSRSIP